MIGIYLYHQWESTYMSVSVSKKRRWRMTRQSCCSKTCKVSRVKYWNFRKNKYRRGMGNGHLWASLNLKTNLWVFRKMAVYLSVMKIKNLKLKASKPDKPRLVAYFLVLLECKDSSKPQNNAQRRRSWISTSNLQVISVRQPLSSKAITHQSQLGTPMTFY